MFCKNCGNQLEDGATVCGKCGATQGPVPVASNPTPVAPQPEQSSNPIPPQNPVYGAAGGAMPMPAPKKKTKAPLMIGIAAVIVLGIVLVIVLVSCFGNKPSANKSSANKLSANNSSVKELSVEDVKAGKLNGYSAESIGEAFEDRFSDCSWEAYEADSNSVVEFKGHVAVIDSSDDIIVIVQFARNAEKNGNGEFYIYSVKVRDNDSGDYTYLTEEEIEGMVDAVYYDGNFSWDWEK